MFNEFCIVSCAKFRRFFVKEMPKCRPAYGLLWFAGRSKIAARAESFHQLLRANFRIFLFKSLPIRQACH